MTVSTDFNGYIFAGTAKNSSGNDIIHIIRTDINFNTVWSNYYEETLINQLEATKICKNYDNTAYFISGRNTAVNSRKPFLMKIDDNGLLLNTTSFTYSGIFLDVEPTSDGGCIAVGYQSNSKSDTVLNGVRRGMICKLDGGLAMSWTKFFHSSSRLMFDNHFMDVAENVTVINSPITNNQDYYFIMGTVSDENGFRSPNFIHVPNLFYCYLDNAGNEIYRNAEIINGVSFDAAYDAQDDKIFFVGKIDWGPGLTFHNIYGKIDLASGSIDFINDFSVPSNLQGYTFTNPVPYKISIDSDTVHIMGFVRDFTDNNSNLYNNVMIPFRVSVFRSFNTAFNFVVNHTNPFSTSLYSIWEPGFTQNYDNSTSPIFQSFKPPIYAPEMGYVYHHPLNAKHHAYIAYNENSANAFSTYDLHFVNTLNTGECAPMKADLLLVNNPARDFIETIIVSGPNPTRAINISVYSLTFNDGSCN